MTKKEIINKAEEAWAEDARTNPNSVNPYAYTYGYLAGYLAHELSLKTEPSRTEECTKPDCDCLEKAEEANNGEGVKNYPCLAGVDNKINEMLGNYS